MTREEVSSPILLLLSLCIGEGGLLELEVPSFANRSVFEGGSEAIQHALLIIRAVKLRRDFQKASVNVIHRVVINIALVLLNVGGLFRGAEH